MLFAGQHNRHTIFIFLSQNMESNKTKKKGIGMYLVGIMILALVIAGCGPTDPKISVCAYAEIEVQSKLRNPDSATFPTCATPKELGGNEYEITSYVTSRNNFAAMVRTNYTCKVRLTETDEYYITCDLRE